MQNRQENWLYSYSILVRLNWRSSTIVRTYIYSSILITFSGHLLSNRVLIHGIVSTYLLIRHLQRIRITQKNLAFVLDITLHRMFVRKQDRISQVLVFGKQIQITTRTLIFFLSTTHMLNDTASKRIRAPSKILHFQFWLPHIVWPPLR